MAEVKSRQRAVDTQGVANRLRTLVAEAVAVKAQACQRAIDAQGVADRLRTLVADRVVREAQLSGHAIRDQPRKGAEEVPERQAPLSARR